MYPIYLIDPNNPVKQKNFMVQVSTPEKLAGMMAVGEGIVSDLYENAYLDTPADISSFRIRAHVPEEYVKQNMSTHLLPGRFGIWLRSATAGRYNLFTFGSDEFIDGIKYMCDIFGVDSRDYIHGFVFDYIGTLYLLTGNSISYFQVALAPINLDDVEIEERGNENIIDPYDPEDEVA